MVKITTVVLKDDIDGSEASRTVNFSLDGLSYEIDLSGENYDRLRSSLQPFVKAGRRTSSRATRRGNSGVATPLLSKEEKRKIREWANNNGYNVSPRGRIPLNVLSAWEVRN